MSSSSVAALAKQLLDMDDGELQPREKAVIERAMKRLAVSRDIDLEFEGGVTFGQRLADRVAQIGGSWGFIIAFGIFIGLWTTLNMMTLRDRALDPYPFVFLNLVLSMIAALQAPIILMSQNRQSARDRLVARHDYEVNLKAEIEIAALHEKLEQIRSQELATLVQRA